jgi:hypothetical protein
MTDQQHPITPPPDLAAKWVSEIYGNPAIPLHPITLCLVERAAQWGADQELEACCQYISNEGEWFAVPGHRLAELRAARRPKPPKPPTDEELDALWIEQYGWTGQLPAMSIAEFKPAARAVLERWGK